MKVTKILFCFLMIAVCFSFAVAQQKLPKVFSPDDSLTSKTVTQKRDMTKYFDGGAFRFGMFGSPDESNSEKLAQTIWQCWREKTLCYLTYSFNGTDSSYTEHIFIEPNKQNQWIIVRRAENGHAMPQYRKPLHDLPKVYFLEWQTIKGEKILVFKNKQKKVFEKFLY